MADRKRNDGERTDQEVLDAARERQAEIGEAQDQAGAALTSHSGSASVVEGADGKIQARHETTVVTDPTSPEAVQGHDDPRVNGALADPLRRAPSPNDIADGAEVDEADAAEHVTVGEASDAQRAAGQPTANAADDDSDPEE